MCHDEPNATTATSVQKITVCLDPIAHRRIFPTGDKNLALDRAIMAGPDGADDVSPVKRNGRAHAAYALPRAREAVQ